MSKFRVTAAVLPCLAMWALPVSAAEEFSAAGCFARWDDSSLTVGNALFSRTYGLRGDVLETRALKDAEGRDRLVRSSDGSGGRLSVSCASGRLTPASADGLLVTVTGGTFVTTLALWPEVPGVLSSQPTARPVPPLEYRGRENESSYRRRAAQWGLPHLAARVADRLDFAAHDARAVAYTLIDQTDMRAELLLTREWLMPSAELVEEIRASALDVRDLVTGRGVVFLRLAPMPDSRPGSEADFILYADRRSVTTVDTGYPLATLVYAGGEEGRIAALQALQRAVRPYRPGRDGVFLSNTWGDGNRDSRINAEFLRKEIDAGAELGVDVIQVDDGWQRGRTMNSAKKTGGQKVWDGYWATDPNYWEPDLERFPEGMGPLAEAARAKGLRFGLWFGPDSSGDAANWERDADKLLSYYRTCGIAYFKIDSLKLRSPLALARNRRFFDKMLEASGAEMVFDLDCTAEERPGYLGLMHIGPLFVENRYASKSTRQYRPHLTLRSLWTLAQVVDPVRLRMEVLNPGKRQKDYGDDPFAPSRWPADALFAVAMTASPLGWMELSDVAPDVMSAWKPLVATWRRERARWHGGVIFPVGNRPDGVAWTGFVSRAADGKGGYALLFRERNARADFTLDLSPYLKAESFAVIGGRGSARLSDGRLSVSVPETFGFVWVKLSDE